MNRRINVIILENICPCYAREYYRAFYKLEAANAEFKATENFAEKLKIAKDIRDRKMRNLVQITEMLGKKNHDLAAAALGHEPTCEEAALHYARHGGAQLFPKKWPDIWKEINGPHNKWCTGVECDHKPDFMERYIHWLIEKGMERFYQLHPEYLSCEVKK